MPAGSRSRGVYIVEDPAPNAFATGRNPKHAAIAVTTGLLEKMNRVELEGVIAHELSHIRNYDILVSTLAVTLVGSIALLTNIGMRMMWWNGGRVRREGDRNGGNPLAILGLVLLIFAPIIAKLMQAAVSRRRETLADVSACQMTRYPPGLISALEKLRDDTTVTHLPQLLPRICGSSSRCRALATTASSARSTACSTPIPRSKSGLLY